MFVLMTGRCVLCGLAWRGNHGLNSTHNAIKKCLKCSVSVLQACRKVQKYVGSKYKSGGGSRLFEKIGFATIQGFLGYTVSISTVFFFEY